MTREEAIRLIGWLKCTTNREDDLEAIDMAIKALSQPIVCKDYCIDDDHIYCSPKVADRVVEALSADAVQGEWVLVKGSNGKDYHKCSKCLHTQEITGVKNYCAVCGTRMKGGDTE